MPEERTAGRERPRLVSHMFKKRFRPVCNSSRRFSGVCVFRTSSKHALEALLGGSWVVISGTIGPLIWVISIVTPLITLLITTHEPPSRAPAVPGFRRRLSDLLQFSRVASASLSCHNIQSSYKLHVHVWVVVKIKVPFWVP